MGVGYSGPAESKHFELRLAHGNPRKFFLSGDRVDFRVHIQLKNPMKISCIVATMLGRVTTNWSEDTSVTDSDGQSRTGTEYFRGEKDYFKHETVLFRAPNPESGQETSPGSLQYNWDFTFPPDVSLPTTFRSDNVEISLKAVIQIYCVGKQNPEFRAVSLEYYQPLSPQLPSLAAPLEIKSLETESFFYMMMSGDCCSCCDDGPSDSSLDKLHVTCRTPFFAYTPGQVMTLEFTMQLNADFMMQVSNHHGNAGPSNMRAPMLDQNQRRDGLHRDISAVHASVRFVADYRNNGYKTKFTVLQMLPVVSKAFGNGPDGFARVSSGNPLCFSMDIPVPENAPVSILNAPLAILRPYLVISVDGHGRKSMMVISFPFVIGTRPQELAGYAGAFPRLNPDIIRKPGIDVSYA